MRAFLIGALCAFLIAVTLPAAAAPTAEEQAAIAKAESYMRNLGRAKARFLQTSGDGMQLLGTFYLSRPGKMRFQYDPPVTDFVVADGFFVYFYDGQLGEQSNAPIGQTLADFLLRPDLRFNGDIRVAGVRRGGGLLQVALVQSSDPQAGSLTLGFEEHPFQLKKWRVQDATGQITEVELFNLEHDIPLDSDLFVYTDPQDQDPAKRRFNQ